MFRRNAGRKAAVMALAAAMLALGACGGSSDENSPTAPQNPPSNQGAQSNGTKGDAALKPTEGHCTYSASSEQTACQDSYLACAETPKPKVEAYKGGNDPTLIKIATSHANSRYGDSGPTWDAGFAGCMAALLDEYTRLQR
jgi:hypothetical protein